MFGEFLCKSGNYLPSNAQSYCWTRGKRLYRAYQFDTGGAPLESPVRTAMHGVSRISSVISVEQTKLANVYLHLLPPISDHVIVHLGGSSCAIFYTPLSAWEYLKMKLKYPLN